MARAWGNNTANRLNRGASLISATSPRPLSWAQWFKANTRNVIHWMYNNNFQSNDPRFGVEVTGNGSTDLLRMYSGGYEPSNTFVLSTTDWTHLGITWDTDDSVAFYVNGVATGTGTKVQGGDTDDGAAIGSLPFSGFDVDGDLAEFGFWNVILDAAEISALASGISPMLVRPASLVSHPPILGNDSPEIDLVDSTTWAINGTLTKADHVGVYRANPMRTFILPVAAAAPPAGIEVFRRRIESYV